MAYDLDGFESRFEGKINCSILLAIIEWEENEAVFFLLSFSDLSLHRTYHSVYGTIRGAF